MPFVNFASSLSATYFIRKEVFYKRIGKQAF